MIVNACFGSSLTAVEVSVALVRGGFHHPRLCLLSKGLATCLVTTVTAPEP